MNIYEMPEDSMTIQERAAKMRCDGVEYKLRVIPGSGGKLELVDLEPRRARMLQWAHIMLINQI